MLHEEPCASHSQYRRLQNVCHREAKSWFRLLTDCGQSYYREQWDHPYKEGSSLFRFHFSVANILQSPVVRYLKLHTSAVHKFKRLNEIKEEYMHARPK